MVGRCMCGIVGYLERAGGAAAPELVRAMADTLRHRGPDDGAVWVDPGGGCALGQRRLAIVDLSPAGAQPMHSACGRYVISYNGEVFNFQDLRAELEQAGLTFRGHSDTEVILAGCAHWGVRATVARLIGMFAFALWDRADRSLTLVRDRLGIKPLYWAQFGQTLLFGSELKALAAHPVWRGQMRPGAVAAFLRYNYLPPPLTIWDGVESLTPGNILTLTADGQSRQEAYWQLTDIIAQPIRFHDADAAEQALADLIDDAVQRRMVADVPLGAFLSGGIDSSTVVAAMQAASPRPVKTFTIGFTEAAYDESAAAAAVARHLGTDHHPLIITPDQAMAVIPDLPQIYDEPFADASQIPTFLVSRLARGQVTVALSGDGGDEVFAGYSRYTETARLWRLMARLPVGLRSLGGRAIRCLPPDLWDRLAKGLPEDRRPRLFGDRLHKLAGVLDAPDIDGLYRRLLSPWGADRLPLAEPEASSLFDTLHPDLADPTARMQAVDSLTYLPGDILTKLDRASMAVSLEARVPLLDHRLVEFGWSLAPDLKLRDGTGKWLLRRVLARRVPPALFERPKMGFGVPIDAWLRGPLRAWAEDLLSDRDDLLDNKALQALWRQHLSGRRNWQYRLWGVLMFRAWRRRWL